MPDLAVSSDPNPSPNAWTPGRALVHAPESDTLDRWAEAYLRYQVTTSESSQREQRRDLETFLSFLGLEVRDLRRPHWTPRVSREFLDHLRRCHDNRGQRRYSDRTVNRMLATLRPWARWIHALDPFPLGNPMSGLKNISVPVLDIERALRRNERRDILDAADRLPVEVGRSKDRRRHHLPPAERPRHRLTRPWRDRATLYTLLETGMRRAAVTAVDLAGVDFTSGTVTTVEKGGHSHTYAISRQGLAAIRDSIEHERSGDGEAWSSEALFLPAREVRSNRTGRLSPRTISNVWSRVCAMAGVTGLGCHAARHAVGLHIIEKTGNPAAVQRQLGHRHAATSLQYCQVRTEELCELMDQR